MYVGLPEPWATDAQPTLGNHPEINLHLRQPLLNVFCPGRAKQKDEQANRCTHLEAKIVPRIEIVLIQWLN